MKKRANLTLALALTAIVWGTGCQQTSQQRRPPPTSAMPQRTDAASPTATAPAARQNCTDPTRGPIAMSKTMPREVTLGETFEYQLVLNAQECVDNVVVTDQVPEGATFVRSEPAAEAAGNLLTWRLNQMDVGQNGTIRVWLKADREGALTSCATVHADPRVCATVLVGKATLEIQKSGPETALLGSMVNYNITVSNNGTSVAKGVVVTDTVPDGLESTGGQKEITYEVGDLAPKQSKAITLSLKAATRGKHCNTAVATATNAERVSAEACTTVLAPGLKLAKSGDQERFLGRQASYKIVVSNTGDTALTDVVVTDVAPTATSIVSASGATVSGNQAVWRLANLPAGEERSFDVVLTSMTAGNHCNTANVTAAGGLLANAEACTVWRGVGAVLLEVVDDPDPIQVDEQTSYTIRVTNQGTADLTNIGVVAQYDEKVTPVSSAEGTVNGQNVQFPVVARLAPKQSITYTIKAKGAKVGDSRTKVSLTADILGAPVVEEESTHVY